MKMFVVCTCNHCNARSFYQLVNNTCTTRALLSLQVLLYHELSPDVNISDVHWLPSHRGLFLVINSSVLGVFYPDDKSFEEVSSLLHSSLSICAV